MIQKDILRMFFGLLSLVPLSYFLKYMKSCSLRYAYSLVTALCLQYFVYQSYMYPIYIQHLIAFAIIKLRGNKSKGALVTFESMAFLSGYHIYEFLYNYGGWTMNASALLMILVCKYSLLAYNLDDARLDEARLSKEQFRNKVTSQISFYQYMGYLNFLPTCLIGPPIEFNDYKDFMEQRDIYAAIPSVLKRTAITFFEVVLFASLYVIGDIYAPLSLLKTHQFYEQSTLSIFWYATLSVYLLRCKYYFGWKMSMCAVHASGVSFDGKAFNRVNTINPWIFETSIHVRDKVGSWNISVQEWLRKCIYQRSPIKSRMLNQLYVFIVSAFWHGFYAAYYISFFLWFMQLHMQSLTYRYFKNGRPLLARLYAKSGILGHVILSIIVMLVWSHNATYMLMLDGAYCLQLMSSVYFAPQILLIVLTIVFTFLPAPREKEAVKGQKEEAVKGQKEEGVKGQKKE